MSDTIKIIGRDPEDLVLRVDCALNIANTMCSAGRLPTDLERDPDSGVMWYAVDSTTYYLYPTANDYWAYVRESGEYYVILQFRFRYDCQAYNFADGIVAAIYCSFKGRQVEIV